MKPFAFGLFLALFQSGCYVTKQFYYQGKRLLQRQDIKEVLLDQSLDTSMRSQLVFLEEILEESAQEGLYTEGAYSKIIMIEEPAVSFVVQAAYLDRLEFKSWWFPIVGHMPYLGYVHQADRDKMASSLIEQGYDVHSFEADGFSSLGFFEDPLFSSMLKKSKYHFANLIFHELIHRTLWIKDHANFNENMASFLADILTKRFFLKKGDQKSLEAIDAYHKDKETFRKWLEELTKALEEFYQALPTLEKRDPAWIEKKAEIFSDFLVKQRPNFLRYDFIGKKAWNNGDVLASRMYSPKTELFERGFACFKDQKIGLFLEHLDRFPDVHEDPFKALSLICSKKSF